MADQDAYDLSPDDALEESRQRSNPYRYFISRRSPHDDDTGEEDPDDFSEDSDDSDERPWHLIIYSERGGD